LLADKNHGFVFAGVADIAKHTKKWSTDKAPYTQRQVERILKTMRDLGVLSPRRLQPVGKRNRWGSALSGHEWWSESIGHYCDFKYWDQQHSRQNVGRDVAPDVGRDVAPDVHPNGDNVGRDVARPTDILTPNPHDSDDLRTRKIPEPKEPFLALKPKEPKEPKEPATLTRDDSSEAPIKPEASPVGQEEAAAVEIAAVRRLSAPEQTKRFEEISGLTSSKQILTTDPARGTATWVAQKASDIICE